jgi:hypothetical protein
MNSPFSFKQVSGFLLFAAGVLLSTLLTAALTWANLEAVFYGFQRWGSDPFNGLTCPPLLTPRETGLILLEVNNPTARPMTPIFRIDTSSAGAPETEQMQVSLVPGQSQRLTQTVTAANIDLGFFIFAKAYRSSAYPLPDAEATCGTMVIDLPFLTGSQIYLLWLGLCLFSLPVGLWLWVSAEALSEGKQFTAAKALAVIALGGLLVSTQTIWMAGILFLALTVLMSAAMLSLAAPR